MTTRSDAPRFLTVKEIVERYKFPSTNACRMWLRRRKHALGIRKRGRDLLVEENGLDRVMVALGQGR